MASPGIELASSPFRSLLHGCDSVPSGDSRRAAKITAYGQPSNPTLHGAMTQP
jgi:hypothetical protein